MCLQNEFQTFCLVCDLELCDLGQVLPLCEPDFLRSGRELGWMSRKASIAHRDPVVL
jgi:hypothetical protein